VLTSFLFSDWDPNPNISLFNQARRLVTDRQSRGVDLWDLWCEQSAYVRVSPYGSIAYLFHSMVLLQVMRRLGRTDNDDEESGNE
ncbi:hypothetical protein QBC45DRAFT_340434, partial [Copromyces sp. CBS 386.78]